MPTTTYEFNDPLDRMLRLVYDQDMAYPAKSKIRHAEVLGIKSETPMPTQTPVIVDWSGGTPIFEERKVPERKVAIYFDRQDEHFLWDSSQ